MPTLIIQEPCTCWNKEMEGFWSGIHYQECELTSDDT